MATTTTNFGWDIPQSTDLVKDGATAIAALGQDIDTAMVDLKGGTTGQVLAKASNTDLDFSWVAQDDSNAIQNTQLTAKGALISAFSAGTPATLTVGTNGQVLTADSAESTGLKWATPAAGAVSLVARTSFSAVASQAFNSVFTSTYKTYLVVIEKLWTTSGGNDLQLLFRYGSTSVTSGYYASSFNVAAGSTQAISNNNDSILTLGADSGTSSAWTTSTLYFNNVGTSAEQPFVRGFSITGNKTANFGGYNSQTAQTINGFLLQAEGGSNITGTVAIYGMAAA
jgi:hypothetical protein